MINFLPIFSSIYTRTPWGDITLWSDEGKERHLPTQRERKASCTLSGPLDQWAPYQPKTFKYHLPGLLCVTYPHIVDYCLYVWCRRPIKMCIMCFSFVYSLVNMYKELEADIEGFKHPGHGDLTGWAKQGVLLLNAVLTVRAHQANSHKDQGWEKLTDAVVHWLSTNLEGLVFMLWGAYAQKKGATIDRKRHHVLQTVHPSPLSAHRGFFGCKHFSKTNELLQKSGKKPIDWKAL
uniref:Uracil DNA glycosylase a n=1 Tax=Astyanax mexicanus TaxID=7994 RepID=A0A8B9JUD1_ASTMX